MSESLSDAVREAAYHRTIHEPAEGAWEDLCEVGCSESAAFRAGFIEGAVWAAERLPSGGDIARLVHPGYGRNGITKETCAACASTEELADKILTLIREHVTRG